MNSELLPVVLAGGSGSRLWPMSRTAYPKQFLTLVGETATMLQQTVERLEGLDSLPPLFVCNEEHRFLLAEQLRQKQFSHSGIILEPFGRNTAPAIALTALQSMQNGDDPLLLILAADHIIRDEAAFRQSIQQALPFAQRGKLVTFGIVPQSPEIGYGYIKRGEQQGESAFSVECFVEKPDLETAQAYLDTGEYYWNSGMFLFRASQYLGALEKNHQEILTVCQQAMANSYADLDFIRISEEIFSLCPDDSIDYAVMEKTSDAVVVPMDAAWNDVGSWTALWEVHDKNLQGNVFHGDVLAKGTTNSYVHANHKLVATVGVEELIIVETKDAVLVADKANVQMVKEVVNELKEQERYEANRHKEVYRPWGKHDEIAAGERFIVKQVSLKPGGRTAMQLHHHRAEHWVVVSGTAEVTKGEETYLLSENESTYIPIGVPHCIHNPGQLPLIFIEVRSGSYLAEDDIVRFEEEPEGEY